MKLSPGELLDQKYRILRLLGTGGMGSVYEAANVRVDRRVAIKVMHEAHDRRDVARFEREARAAQIGSPNIVQVFDLGYLPDGAPYMVMEYLAGESLGERLRRVGKLAPFELLPIGKQILDGLEAAHREGIIHRDLKPDNVFLVRGQGSAPELVKLLDFGISKFTDARRASDVKLTKSGISVGTPHFMSPEQVHGAKDLDTRTDLYSLGVILYRGLSGQLPFESDDVAPLLVQILLEEPKPLRTLCPSIDPELSALVERAMARRAKDRFATAAEFRTALDRWQRTQSLDARRGFMPKAHPARLPHANSGTHPPWTSSAVGARRANHRRRNVLAAMMLSSAGIAGLFAAYQLWTSGTRTTPTMAGAAAPLPQALVAAAATMLSAAPAAAVPPDDGRLAPPPPLGRTAAAAPIALMRDASRVGLAVPVPAAPAAVEPSQSATPSSPPDPGPFDAPVEPEPDNRHLSRGVP